MPRRATPSTPRMDNLVRQPGHARQYEALDVGRAVDVTEVFERLEQRAHLGSRNPARVLEESVLVEEVVGAGDVFLLELTRISHDLDRPRPVLRVGEPSHALIVDRKYLRERALVGIGPGAPDNGAGEGQFSRAIEGETEIGEARRLRVDIERREQDRGIDGAALQRR